MGTTSGGSHELGGGTHDMGAGGTCTTSTSYPSRLIDDTMPDKMYHCSAEQRECAMHRVFGSFAISMYVLICMRINPEAVAAAMHGSELWKIVRSVFTALIASTSFEWEMQASGAGLDLDWLHRIGCIFECDAYLDVVHHFCGAACGVVLV